MIPNWMELIKQQKSSLSNLKLMKLDLIKGTFDADQRMGFLRTFYLNQ